MTPSGLALFVLISFLLPVPIWGFGGYFRPGGGSLN